jgi:hypothetical protein
MARQVQSDRDARSFKEFDGHLSERSIHDGPDVSLPNKARAEGPRDQPTMQPRHQSRLADVLDIFWLLLGFWMFTVLTTNTYYKGTVPKPLSYITAPVTIFAQIEATTNMSATEQT